MLKDVTSVEFIGDFRLRLTFDDGKSGEVDLAKHIAFTGIFAPLKDPNVFRTGRVDPDLGTICWPNGADVDPVVLYSWVFSVSIPDYSHENFPIKDKVA